MKVQMYIYAAVSLGNYPRVFNKSLQCVRAVSTDTHASAALIYQWYPALLATPPRTVRCVYYGGSMLIHLSCSAEDLAIQTIKRTTV